jgi:hypothetical protein
MRANGLPSGTTVDDSTKTSQQVTQVSKQSFVVDPAIFFYRSGSLCSVSYRSEETVKILQIQFYLTDMKLVLAMTLKKGS